MVAAGVAAEGVATGLVAAATGVAAITVLAGVAAGVVAGWAVWQAARTGRATVPATAARNPRRVSFDLRWSVVGVSIS
jgi:hypothetical protein